jgi:hypothetical protein
MEWVDGDSKEWERKWCRLLKAVSMHGGGGTGEERVEPRVTSGAEDIGLHCHGESWRRLVI